MIKTMEINEIQYKNTALYGTNAHIISCYV
jgi:hypothetical protein